MGVRHASCTDIAAALAGGSIRVIDVRTPMEWEIVRVEGTELLDPALLDSLQELPRDTPLAFLCHHGVRSFQAAAHFAALGFTNVTNITGGIDAWAVQVDPGLPRY